MWLCRSKFIIELEDGISQSFTSLRFLLVRKQDKVDSRLPCPTNRIDLFDCVCTWGRSTLGQFLFGGPIIMQSGFGVVRFVFIHYEVI